MKESSSLKNQELLFIRRPDLTEKDRLDLAIAGLGAMYRDSSIASIKARYQVSHTFIYNSCFAEIKIRKKQLVHSQISFRRNF